MNLSSVRSVSPLALASERGRIFNRSCRKAARPSLVKRRTVNVQASIDTSAAFAVGQQNLMFALVAGGELAYQLADRAKEKGGPSLVIVGPCLAGCVAAWGLLQTGNDGLAHIGLFAGLVGTGALGFHCVQRVDATQSRPEDWPGAKIWPSTIALFSLLALLANVEGLLNL